MKSSTHVRFRMRLLFTVTNLLLSSTGAEAGVTARASLPFLPSSRLSSLHSVSTSSSSHPASTILDLRGGAGSSKAATTSSGSNKKKKTRKKSKTSAKKRKANPAAKASDSSLEDLGKKQSKQEIDKVLHETDAAQALGDAIRSRANELRSTPLLASIDNSVSSVGWALGASDVVMQRQEEEQSREEYEDDADHGGVEGAPASVVVHYFLKSHGGAHALQCCCSLLASVAGLGVLALNPTTQSNLVLVLMQRCLLFAMIKHVSGLLAACIVAAKAIPQVGLSQSRVWMEQLATDPVSQYVFYAACGIVWLGTVNKHAPLEWWQASRLVPSLMVGPIVLREVLSTLLVLSDVLVLWACNTASEGTAIRRLLAVSQSLVNAWMSLLVTPSVWRSANASQRQAILAKLVSRTSLAMEVLIGLVYTVDAAKNVAAFSFASVSARPPFLTVLKRLLCTRLYLHFLWMRRKRITKLASKLRGGAAQVPFYVLECLADPRKAMGIESDEKDGGASSFFQTENDASDEDTATWTWNDYARIALGLDDSK